MTTLQNSQPLHQHAVHCVICSRAPRSFRALRPDALSCAASLTFLLLQVKQLHAAGRDSAQIHAAARDTAQQALLPRPASPRGHSRLGRSSDSSTAPGARDPTGARLDVCSMAASCSMWARSQVIVMMETSLTYSRKQAAETEIHLRPCAVLAGKGGGVPGSVTPPGSVRKDSLKDRLATGIFGIFRPVRPACLTWRNCAKLHRSIDEAETATG